MHHHSSSHNGASTVLAFIAGVSAGIAAGVLLAPREGRETRRQIKDKVQHARSRAMEEAGDQVEKVKEVAATVKNRGEELAEGVKENAQDRTDELRQTAARATQKAAHDTKHATR